MAAVAAQTAIHAQPPPTSNTTHQSHFLLRLNPLSPYCRMKMGRGRMKMLAGAGEIGSEMPVPEMPSLYCRFCLFAFQDSVGSPVEKHAFSLIFFFLLFIVFSFIVVSVVVVRFWLDYLIGFKFFNDDERY
uniref:Uncharacterized protein n=1 Tax=Nelumbo nucifera TaxID=4432 RepID=A0A822ZTP5_NELNU|nr:TPA_asm: hypothetical protein HUJ06_018260 [Nelumbo nucifera]